MAGVTPGAVGERLAEVHHRIERAGGDWQAITLVAVTKDFLLDAVAAGLANGLQDCGENRAEGIRRKQFAGVSEISKVRWHYLGRVQRNQVRKIAAHVALWQAVDRTAAGEEIAKRAPGAAVLVQVNISGEPQKHGARSGDVPGLVDDLLDLDLDVQGLMAVGPTGPPEDARPGFNSLVALADRLDLRVRSIG